MIRVNNLIEDYDLETAVGLEIDAIMAQCNSVESDIPKFIPAEEAEVCGIPTGDVGTAEFIGIESGKFSVYRTESPDGRYMADGCHEDIYIYQKKSGELFFSKGIDKIDPDSAVILHYFNGSINDLAFSPDSTKLAVGGKENWGIGSILLIDLETFKVIDYHIEGYTPSEWEDPSVVGIEWIDNETIRYSHTDPKQGFVAGCQHIKTLKFS